MTLTIQVPFDKQQDPTIVEMPLLAPCEAMEIREQVLHRVSRYRKKAELAEYRVHKSNELRRLICYAMRRSSKANSGVSYGVNYVSRLYQHPGFSLDGPKNNTPDLAYFAQEIVRIWVEGGIAERVPNLPKRTRVSIDKLDMWVTAMSLLWDNENQLRWYNGIVW